MYKILVELKDRYIVKRESFFTILLKSVTHISRMIRVEKLLKHGKIKMERYIPAMINRLNHS
jgi:hypothetical protein